MMTLLEEIEHLGGVVTLRMESIRDDYGARRLSIQVRDGIARWLASQGIGHYPRPLPQHQHLPVRLYKKGSPVGNLIEAVLELDPQRDAELVSAATGADQVMLRQIRELVCP